MAENSLTARLLAQVLKRMQLAAIGRRFFTTFLVCCGVFAAVLLAARFSGLIALPAAESTWLAFSAVPLVSGLFAWLLHRRPSLPDAARLVDRSTGAKDLYLTVSMLGTSAGAYQPLVVQSAESRAANVKPEVVLPFTWQKRFWHAVWVPGLVALGIFFLPQFDPFGKVAAAKLNERRNDRLAEQKKATELRLEEVKRQLEEHEESNPTDSAIEELKLTFNKMKADKKNENLKMLSSDQKDIGKLWRQISSEKLKDLMKSSASSDQQFGANQDEKLKKWVKELQEGDAGGVQNELQELKEQLQQLAATKDPLKRSELMQELKERLQNLEKMAHEKLNNEQLASALERAMQQMELSENKDMQQDAMESAMQSLELSEKELEQVQQAVKDMKELEEALRTIQQAKKLNDQEKLDGAQTEKCKTLAEYEALYAEMLAQGEAGEEAGEEEGEGGGPGGFGKGGAMPEDDSVETGFKSEQSKSAVVAGKMLLSMQTKGEAEKGEVVRDYKQLLKSVKQGAMEAMNTEQIPPGYHESIKSYFDSLEKNKESKSK
ncbi:coiled-coil domain-containing protein [Schlesneria paludicola]|uniref:hypothetical protein n=1 Tax=Schlesneria paludicola TaxID=360056 RepID=UPI00029AA9A5|nr:hypothetical protein [Schlesneria paludicola]